MRATTFVCGALALTAVLGCSEKKKSTGPSGPSAPPSAWKAAVGDQGTLVETFDDESWEVRQVTDKDLRAVSCVDNEVGWAAGVNGFIGHTRDGGWSWPAQDSGVSETLHAISFAFDGAHNEVGLAVGDAGTLITTRNGGQRWSQVRLEGVTSALRGTAVTEQATLLLAVGDLGVIARSEDQGQTFSVYHIEGATELTDVALDASGALALAVDTNGAIWVSRDRAQTFTLEHTASVALESVSLGRSGAVGAAAGAAGSALVRDRAGAWSELTTGTDVALHATLVGPHEDRVYFAGDAGTLLESTDLASTTFRVEANTTAALRGIEDLEER